ncbi:hypothetical protein FHX80_11224 [Streptomyces brevispora]|uniref:Uncharacterized protein n=1 Tax=Streptomyces brevispora TaxID=887462 RepID=A0A561UR35_9ACTN|nr:hypothetical protein FHX80_11224 [Streptomyces brevispora]
MNVVRTGDCWGCSALDHLLPAATGESPWPHPELEFYRYAASDIAHAAADAGEAGARAAVGRLQAPPDGDPRALRPAAEQLDSIAGEPPAVPRGPDGSGARLGRCAARGTGVR